MRALRHAYRLLPAIFLLAAGCGDGGSEYQAPADYVYRQPAQLNDGWESASLESVGMDPAPLVSLMNELRTRGRDLVHGIVIVRHGRLVFEEYFPGLTHPTFGEEPIVFNRDTAHCLSSVAKSFTATLLGLAIEHGFIASVDQRALELFPELGDLNVGQKRDITLEHLVTMTSGLEWDESSYSLRDSRNDLTAWLNLARTTSEDPVRAVFERPMVATPGTVLNYGGGNTNVVGKAIQEASGLRLDAFAREYLFAPMGIEDVWWWVLREDFVYASGDLTLRPRDMVKVGLMYLNGGMWRGQRVLSPAWVEASASAYSSFSEGDPVYGGYGSVGYSYGWWVKSGDYGPGAYDASGWGGQRIIVLPELDMVVALTGGAYWEPAFMTPHEIMVDYVLPSAR